MSAIKNLVEEYANLVFPDNPDMADILAGKILSGELPICVDALLHEVSRMTGRGPDDGTIPRATER